MTAQTPLQSLNFLLHPNEVSMPSWTTSFHLFLKVYVQYSLYLLAFLVSKELSLRLQSPQGGNYLFKNILSSHYTILTESTVKWLTKHKVKKVIMSQLTQKKNPKWIYSRYFFFFQDAKGHVNKLGVLWVSQISPWRKKHYLYFQETEQISEIFP